MKQPDLDRFIRTTVPASPEFRSFASKYLTAIHKSFCGHSKEVYLAREGENDYFSVRDLPKLLEMGDRVHILDEITILVEGKDAEAIRMSDYISRQVAADSWEPDLECGDLVWTRKKWPGILTAVPLRDADGSPLKDGRPGGGKED